MMFRNCPNCAAPLDQDVDKCPYCGTPYIDICGIKLDGSTPFVLKLETTINNRPAIVSCLMVADPSFILDVSYEKVYAIGGRQQVLAT